MAAQTTGTTRSQASQRRRLSDRRSLRREQVDSIQAQRQRFYALKRSGYANAEAAAMANEEAEMDAGDEGISSLPRAARSSERRAGRAEAREEAGVPAAALAPRREQLAGRKKQHTGHPSGPTFARTPKAGRVARMMTPDEDELGTPEEPETKFHGAMVHTHEGREPPAEEVEAAEDYSGRPQGPDDDTYHKAEGAPRMRGGRGARSGTLKIPDAWEDMNFQQQKALVRDATGQQVTTRAQAEAVLRREHRKQSRGGSGGEGE